MDDLQAIQQLKYRYCYALNGADVDGVVDLFAPDARFETPAATDPDYPHGFEGAAVGHEEIRATFETIVDEFERSAHLVVNPLVEVAGDEAVGQWYYLAVLVTADGLEVAQGRYDDEYRRIDGDWTFASCAVRRNATLIEP